MVGFGRAPDPQMRAAWDNRRTLKSGSSSPLPVRSFGKLGSIQRLYADDLVLLCHDTVDKSLQGLHVLLDAQIHGLPNHHSLPLRRLDDHEYVGVHVLTESLHDADRAVRSQDVTANSAALLQFLLSL